MTAKIAIEFLDEVDRAADKHGRQQDLPMFDRGNRPKTISMGCVVKSECQEAFREGNGSWAAILLEEVGEAMDEVNDMDALRVELVQAGAMCMAMIRALDHQRGHP